MYRDSPGGFDRKLSKGAYELFLQHFVFIQDIFDIIPGHSAGDYRSGIILAANMDDCIFEWNGMNSESALIFISDHKLSSFSINNKYLILADAFQIKYFTKMD